MSVDGYVDLEAVAHPHLMERGDPVLRLRKTPAAVLVLTPFYEPFARGLRPLSGQDCFDVLFRSSALHGQLGISVAHVPDTIALIALEPEVPWVAARLPQLGGECKAIGSVPLAEHQEGWSKLTPGFWVVTRVWDNDHESTRSWDLPDEVVNRLLGPTGKAPIVSWRIWT